MQASSVKNKNSEPTYSLRKQLTFADSAYKFCEFHLHLRTLLTFCGIHLQLLNPEKLAIFACCGICGTTNMPTKFTLQVFVRGIHGSFVSGIHLHFETCLRVFRNIQTQNCAPVQCRIWPCKDKRSLYDNM